MISNDKVLSLWLVDRSQQTSCHQGLMCVEPHLSQCVGLWDCMRSWMILSVFAEETPVHHIPLSQHQHALSISLKAATGSKVLATCKPKAAICNDWSGFCGLKPNCGFGSQLPWLLEDWRQKTVGSKNSWTKRGETSQVYWLSTQTIRTRPRAVLKRIHSYRTKRDSRRMSAKKGSNADLAHCSETKIFQCLMGSDD